MSLLFQPGRSSARHLVHGPARAINYEKFPQRKDSSGAIIPDARAPAVFLQPFTSDQGFYYDNFYVTETDKIERYDTILPFWIGTGTVYDSEFNSGFNIGYVFNYDNFADTFLSFSAFGYFPWYSVPYEGADPRPHPVKIGCSLSFGVLTASQLNDYHASAGGKAAARWPVTPLAYFTSTEHITRYHTLDDSNFQGLPDNGLSVLDVNEHLYLHKPQPFSQTQYLYVTFDVRYGGVGTFHEIVVEEVNNFYFSLYSSNKDSQLVRNTYG